MEIQPPPQHGIDYHVPPDVLLRFHFRRRLFRKETIKTIVLLWVAAGCFYFAGGQLRTVAYVVAAVPLLLPWIWHRALAIAIKRNPTLTVPKTLTFDAERVVVVGPNFRSEFDWSMFNRFTEDETYFYLEMAGSGFVSMIPKIAFSAEEKEAFRRCATARTG